MAYTSILLFIIYSLIPLKQEDPVRILFFGDSLTAGYGLSENQAFPALVEEKLNENASRYKVINAGLSGETSAGGKSRIEWVLRQPVDIMVLELGANDGLRGLPLDQTKSNLQAIIDKARAKNPDIQIIIAGMQVPPNLGQEYSTSFQQIFPELAKKKQCHINPFSSSGSGR